VWENQCKIIIIKKGKEKREKKGKKQIPMVDLK
jgi:hypothetical protein